MSSIIDSVLEHVFVDDSDSLYQHDLEHVQIHYQNEEGLVSTVDQYQEMHLDEEADDSIEENDADEDLAFRPIETINGQPVYEAERNMMIRVAERNALFHQMFPNYMNEVRELKSGLKVDKQKRVRKTTSKADFAPVRSSIRIKSRSATENIQFESVTNEIIDCVDEVCAPDDNDEIVSPLLDEMDIGHKSDGEDTVGMMVVDDLDLQLGGGGGSGVEYNEIISDDNSAFLDADVNTASFEEDEIAHLGKYGCPPCKMSFRYEFEYFLLISKYYKM